MHSTHCLNVFVHVSVLSLVDIGVFPFVVAMSHGLGALVVVPGGTCMSFSCRECARPSPVTLSGDKWLH